MQDRLYDKDYEEDPNADQIDLTSEISSEGSDAFMSERERRRSMKSHTRMDTTKRRSIAKLLLLPRRKPSIDAMQMPIRAFKV